MNIDRIVLAYKFSSRNAVRLLDRLKKNNVIKMIGSDKRAFENFTCI